MSVPRLLALLACAVLCVGCGRFGFELHSENGKATGTGDGEGGASGAEPPLSGQTQDGGNLVLDGGGGAGTSSGGADGSTGGADGSTGGDTGTATGTTSSDAGGTGCANPVALLHRYTFDGTGTGVTDSVGSADGSVVGTSLDGDGALTLSGSGDYVDLPGGLISGSSAVTILLWVEWNSGGQHQVLFDVGATQEGPNLRGTPASHVQLKVSTPQSGFVLTALTPNTTATLSVFPLLSVGAIDQVAVVLDAANDVMRLYQRGVLLDTVSAPGLSLGDIDDVDFWLGGTLNASDADFRGLFHDAQVYRGAFDDCQVANTEVDGPDGSTAPGCGCP